MGFRKHNKWKKTIQEISKKVQNYNIRRSPKLAKIEFEKFCVKIYILYPGEYVKQIRVNDCVNSHCQKMGFKKHTMCDVFLDLEFM